MTEKQMFYEWWKNNGCRGISFCEINYTKLPNKIIREYVKEVSKTNKEKAKQKIIHRSRRCKERHSHDKSAHSAYTGCNSDTDDRPVLSPCQGEARFR
jgi:hypothetical protein